MTLASKILPFLSNLEITARLPKGVAVMNPYQHPYVFQLCKAFYQKYYGDLRQRTLLLGINPGRLGAGLTGIPFTDPGKLENECGIANTLPRRAELSADFVYQVIHAFGGLEPFFGQFYISSVSPLGFTRQGINLNYYDEPALQKKLIPFIVASLKAQLEFGVNRKVCFCLGEGKNFKFLSALNAQHQFFEKIIPLAHPRFVMQYRRKKINEYIAGYLNLFDAVNPKAHS